MLSHMSHARQHPKAGTEQGYFVSYKSLIITGPCDRTGHDMSELLGSEARRPSTVRQNMAGHFLPEDPCTLWAHTIHVGNSAAPGAAQTSQMRLPPT
eukprot:scaffold31_cov334-Pavlova_lutheri.AAC.63